MNKEIWVKINNVCKISNLGNVKSLTKMVKQLAKNGSTSTHTYKSKKLKPILHNTGYLYVTLNGKQLAVHRLVAQAFLPNPNNLPQVNHKDGNKKNNCVDNLEWCSCSENMKHAFKNNLLNTKTEKRKKSNLINITKANISNLKRIIKNSTNQEHINVTKLKLRLLEAQLNREWSNNKNE